MYLWRNFNAFIMWDIQKHFKGFIDYCTFISVLFFIETTKRTSKQCKICFQNITSYDIANYHFELSRGEENITLRNS